MICIPPPEHSGWIRHSDGSYAIGWEAPEVQEKIKHTIDFLTKDAVAKQVASATGVLKEIKLLMYRM